jgi:ATP-binding cassette subfamily B (MDR/TAP) protein 1
MHSRLSTIRHADNIVVMQTGVIVEQGKHDELLEKRGAYYNLVEAQRIAAQKERFATDDVEEIEEESAVNEKDMEKVLTEKGDPDDLKLAKTKTSKSVSSIELEKRKEESEKQYSLWTLIKLVFGFNKPEWHIMALGFFGSIVAGGGNPTQAVFFAK